MPERIYREEERVDRVGRQVDDEPEDERPLPLQEEDDGLETVDRAEYSERDDRQWPAGRDLDDQVDEVDGGRGEDDGAEQVDEDEETHREAAEAAHVLQRQQFAEIVDGGVDPSTTLRQQDSPCLRRGGHGGSVGNELGLVVREVLEQECGEVSILAEREQVLLVQCLSKRSAP